ncbi:MAG: hypothetical protein Rhob2KO_27520 [Rhodopirellula baltica]
MFGEYKTYVTLTLKNTGDLPADNVRVVFPRFGDLPADGRFQYERSDGAARGDSFVSEFDIGTVEAEQLADVSFWTSEELGEGDQLTLSSKSGKEYVQLREKQSSVGSISYLWFIGILAVAISLGTYDKFRASAMDKEAIEFRKQMIDQVEKLIPVNKALTESYTRLSNLEKSLRHSQSDSEDSKPIDASPEPN